MRLPAPRTLTARLNVYIGAATCALLVFTVWVSYSASRQLLGAQTNQEALKQVHANAEKMDDFVTRISELSNRIAARQQTIGSEPAPAPAPPRSAQGHLLVADDNEANRDVLSRRLEREGYTVAASSNGREALEMLRQAAFDLVLLDIMMPEVDGFQVLQQSPSRGSKCATRC